VRACRCHAAADKSRDGALSYGMLPRTDRNPGLSPGPARCRASSSMRPEGWTRDAEPGMMAGGPAPAPPPARKEPEDIMAGGAPGRILLPDWALFAGAGPIDPPSHLPPPPQPAHVASGFDLGGSRSG